MKFIHAADIHLDSPLRGLSRYEGAPVELMQTATRRAFINMIDLACKEAVDFILLAGDLYDGDWKDYNTGLFFNQQMSRLREANIKVFMVLGNHDASNTITRQLRLPDNVIEFSDQEAETKYLEDLGVAIHGQSFANKVITDDLSANYPDAISDYFNIGVLHTALNGRNGHDNYAPCTIPGLLSHGYDYWALGHVHQREIIHEKPWIVFSGNLQGRHVRETGAKGCSLVTVEDGQTKLSHVSVDVLRWQACTLDVSEITVAEDLLDKTHSAVTKALEGAEDRPLALRFVITGTSPINNELHSNSERWLNEIRAVATDAGLGKVWIEKINLQLSKKSETALGEIGNFLKNMPKESEILEALSTEFKSLKNALPLEARTKHTETIDPDTICRLLENGVEELLMARLLAHG
jgi:DNA repair exonuclease SbcCD nuclease subunit